MSITVGQAVLLGILQGLTEFLPVSSTAHLALAQSLIPGFSQPGILFDVLLHLGTLVAVVAYFRGRIGETASGLVAADSAERRAAWKLVALLVFAVGLTGAVALPLRKLAVSTMSDMRMIGASLCGTALLLSAAQAVGRRRGAAGRALPEVRFRDAALVGVCQAASAVFHGFSRSGNTISVGLFSGMSRQTAAEFSFLLSIPTILAAAASENLSAYRHHPEAFGAGAWPVYLVGMAVAAVVGYAAIAALLRLVVSMRLVPFIAYTGLLGLFLLVRSA
ncbi:MAG TPA: undecaprenyl-diphosphate phosphatase [Thermoanaerobaculia bacterium]|nr:undecaprenyl-diphosphate phosphatase [Thermoanaerobaculia bacterium]